MSAKQTFTLNGERYVVDETGKLVPLIEEEIKVKEEPWQAANTITETCKILKLGRNTVMKLINTGQLKAIRAGVRRLLVPGWALEEFLGITNKS
jgi:excisionase family DNA binding protein